jgi:CheY-like chemotaxis protein/glycine cleavage system H lipoate-binding protein
MDRQKTIVVVDDEIRICQSFERALGKQGYHVETFTSGDAALERLKGDGVDLVVSDLMMPEKSGLDVLREMREQGITTNLVMITGYANIENALDTMQLGAVDYLPKPFTVAELTAVVARALRANEVNRDDLPAPPKGTYEIVNHSWTRPDEGEEMVVGAHPLVLKCCGALTEVELPMEEDELVQGGPFGKLVADDHRVPIRLWCPISGVVKATNTRAVENPAIVSEDPYGEGWLLKMKPNNLDANLKVLVASS